YGTNIVVSDMTVDCNYSSGNVTYHGVNLFGSRHAIRRVKVIKAVWHNTGAVSESFPIGISASVGGVDANSEGNVIEDCEVSNYQGGLCSAISLNNNSSTSWISGTVRNNRIFLTSADAYNQVAINGNNAINYLVEGNYVNGASAGFYGDTLAYTNLIVAHNTFLNCREGIFIPSGSVRKNMSFLFNNIEITNNPSVETYGILLSAGPIYTNVLIMGNNMQFRSGGTGSHGHGIYAANVLGLTMAYNFVDSQLPNTILTCTNVNAHDNFDMTGRVPT